MLPATVTRAFTTAPPQELRRRLRALAAAASLETLARAAGVREALSAPLAPGSDVYITWLPRDDSDARVAAARELRRAGLNPVPHLAARHLASRAELRDLLARLDGEAGVTQLLLIGGDRDRPNGPFCSSREVLEQSDLARHGIRRVGLAAYPEGHPRIPDAVLERELAAKIACLRRAGVAPYVVTQFCFEARPIRAWLDRFRARESEVPVHVGLAGPAKTATLLKFAATCGIGASWRALRRGTLLLMDAGPEAILHELVQDERHADIARLHLFTFGGVPRTASWLGAVAEGAFSLRDDGLGFRVG